MGDNNILEEIQQLRAELSAVADTVNTMLQMMKAVRDEVHMDHEKLEQLEVTAKHDHKMLQSLEQSRRSLEVTGRIRVARNPVGL